MDQSSKSERPQKSTQAFRTISEVADELDLPQHVLRFWESKFKQISPMKRGGGRRYYRPEDVELLRTIKSLLHFDGYTIKGVQKLLSSGGLKSLGASDPALASEGADETPVQETRSQARSEASLQPAFDLAGLAVLVRELEDIRDHMKKSVS